MKDDEFSDFMKRLELQSNEFAALDELVKAYKNLPPVVDDDYPAARHVYEGKLVIFITALVANRPEQVRRSVEIELEWNNDGPTGKNSA